MASAKDIIVKPIKSSIANEFIKKNHYSGKIVQNSCLHFGCFLNGILGGVMSFGSSLDKRHVYDLLLPQYAKYCYSPAYSPYSFFENLLQTTKTRLQSMLHDNLVRNLYSFPGLQVDSLTDNLIKYLLQKFITEYLNI